MVQTDKHGGGCLCGAVRFVAEGPPLWVAHCHCHSCRRHAGAAVTTYVGYGNDRVTWQGNRAVYESSPGARRGFCPTCGSTLTYAGDRFPDEIHIHVSAFDEPDRFPAQVHVNFAEKVSWFDVRDDLNRCKGFSGDADA